MVEIAVLGNGHGPPPGGPMLKVLYPPPGGEITGVILSHRPVALWTHFYSATQYAKPCTSPCIEPQEACEGCRRGLARRWKAYLGCWSRISTKAFIAEITAEAARQERRLGDQVVDLRGLLLTLQRPGGNTRGRVWATLATPAHPIEGLPPPIDIMPYLCRLWGFQWIGLPGEEPREGGGQ